MRCKLEVARCQGIEKPQYVDRARSVREPPHRILADLDKLIRVWQGLPEFVQQLPEIGACLPLGRVGPELERKSRAVLRISTQRNQSEKPLHAA